MRRYKLSREAKNKAEKNRAKVNEAFWKSIHAARAEKAAEEREKKRREMKVRRGEGRDIRDELQGGPSGFFWCHQNKSSVKVQLPFTVETAYKVYVCSRGNLLFMRIYLITDLKFL